MLRDILKEDVGTTFFLSFIFFLIIKTLLGPSSRMSKMAQTKWLHPIYKEWV